jgi:hypothetical protein
MATVTNNRKVCSIEGKVKVIHETERVGGGEKTCVRHLVSLSSVIQIIWKIISAFEQNELRIK